MRKPNNNLSGFFLGVLILFSSIYCFRSEEREFNSTERLAAFAKVWGFLKYYHPGVGEGKINWDSVLMVSIPKIENEESIVEFNQYVYTLIKSLGEVSQCNDCIKQFYDSALLNYNFGWFDDTFIFEEFVIDELRYIRDNKRPSKNYYVQTNPDVGNTIYENEISYSENVLPDKKLRLLSLFRYWNIINYFYPYKYLVKDDWDDILFQFIPKFKQADDTLTYHLTVRELTTHIYDTHAATFSLPINNFLGYYDIPIKVKRIEGNFIATDSWSDSLAELNNLRIGDIILAINEKPIDDIVQEKIKYYGGSNEVSIFRYFAFDIFCYETEKEVNVKVLRDKDTVDIVSQRYLLNNLYKLMLESKENIKWKFIENEIGYVNMELLDIEDVDSMMTQLLKLHAIIFDLRNGANGTMYEISRYLNKSRIPFVKYYYPDLDYPGVFHYNYFLKTGPNYINNDYYKGLVVLLVNEETQSHAEFTAMVLQTAPSVVTIGSQTAGTDGNVSIIELPGDIITYFTGVGIEYPNGSPSQQTGIKIDIYSIPTIEGIRANRDEVLLKAIEFIHEYENESF